MDLGRNDILSVSFVGPITIQQINEAYVGHSGTTDVISFVYDGDIDDEPDGAEENVAVELFVCMDVALSEGRSRAGSSYADELVLYLVHGILHAAGEDDLDPVKRRHMRKREKEVIQQLKKEFTFGDIFPEPEETT